ncbi:protein translocase subunit SecD [Streptomyces sp. SCUT-3]|uniref:protein translocase subunit SecD n=1 Tax=Streptomyces sp. SCUT-3 TaxID=2684469 RepID=UPI0015F90854|nr:protein translocase subunit SecD [Streptomyces sp. SCUT-3]QMV24225.1 protein translocase subunit SecD [Streptomyces sp. SCUT-3]
MAAPKKGRPQGRPGRALALILVAMVAMVATMFLTGHTTPRLGIDLAGGTSITLTAKSDQASAINPTNMNTAVGIIERRVNGLGVSEAEVQTQGDRNIIANIPKGTDEKQAVDQVGTTALLYFRPVLTMVQAAPAASPSPSGNASGSGTASPEPKGTASPEPKDSGKPKGADESVAAEPSAGATTQGRAVSDALRADAPKSPEASASAKPPEASGAAKASESAAPAGSEPPAAPSAPASPGGLDTAVPADLQKKLEALDCTDPKSVDAATKGVKPGEKMVACDEDGLYKYALGPAAVQGRDVDKASAVLDTQSGAGWMVTMDFNSAGTEKFAEVTGKLAQQAPPNNQFAIVLDNEVVSAPSVSSTIGGGQAQITGNFDQKSAEELANVLSFGALPLSFSVDEVTSVSPQLGGEQLEGGLIAGAIGFVLVVVYMLVYYRGLAFISIISLFVSAILTYAIMCLLGPAIGFALNLPAVCGAIVAVGITADSFIVFFERIRDEVREGRSLQPAVARAWPRARRTILVSDFVSFLAAAVLFAVSVGKVQGFAFTLGLTTLLDVVVVYLFTRPLMTILAKNRFFSSGHPWSGLDPKRLGATVPLRGRRRPVRTAVKEA